MSNDFANVPEEEVRALFAAPSLDGQDEPPQAPCRIHLKSGLIFVVVDVGSWDFVDAGVFATGRFSHDWDVDSKEKDLTIPWGSISFIEHDLDALERYLQQGDDDE